MLLRMALRNLFRHRWRTGLTIGGIAVSTALLIALMALLTGIYDEMAEGVTSLEIGQVQIQSAEYVERASIHHYFELSPQLLETLEDADGIDAVSGRVVAHGLIGEEEDSRIARIKGVEPGREAEVTILEEALVQGEWLSEQLPEPDQPRQLVLGAVVADGLGVEKGDELVVLVQAADGALGNELLEVTGIVDTGNVLIDRQTAYMHIEDLQFITALDGMVHEVALAADLDDAPRISEQLRLHLDEQADEPLVVRPWQEIATDVYVMTALAEEVGWVLLLIIFAVAALGIFNTLRMSTLERRREFGVMMGVGLSRVRLAALIVVEGVMLGLLGAVIGGIAGGVLAWGLGSWGLDLAWFTDQEAFHLMGVAFAERIFFDVSARAVLTPVIGIVVVTALCTLWPAARAIAEDPQETIAGR